MAADRVLIRTAAQGDVDTLVCLLKELFAVEVDFAFDAVRARTGLQCLLEAVPTRTILVADVEGRVVGMCTAQEVVSTAEGGGAAWVEDVVVEPAYRGRGIARALLQAVEHWARGRGIERLQLLADRHNTPALDLYAHEHWQPTQLLCWRKRLARGQG